MATVGVKKVRMMGRIIVYRCCCRCSCCSQEVSAHIPWPFKLSSELEARPRIYYFSSVSQNESLVSIVTMESSRASWFFVYRVAQNEISRQTICNLSATSRLILDNFLKLFNPDTFQKLTIYGLPSALQVSSRTAQSCLAPHRSPRLPNTLRDVYRHLPLIIVYSSLYTLICGLGLLCFVFMLSWCYICV